MKRMRKPRDSIGPAMKQYLTDKGLPVDVAVTFKDVTIIDQYSVIPSRSDEYINTGSNLGKKIFLRRPVFSSNMDTITESRMAITLARLGGSGVIHQFLPIDKRVAEVSKVKRADSLVLKDPLTTSPRTPIKAARTLMETNQISGLIVVDERSEEVVGLISGRDIRWADDGEEVRTRMTPFIHLDVAPPDISLEEAKKILYEKRLEKLPLVDQDRRRAGLITASDISKRERYQFAFRDEKGRLGVAAAVGIGEDMLREVEILLGAETDIIVIDTARGNSKRLRDAVKSTRKKFGDKFLLVAGNVDTPDGVKMLYDSGADAVKVGIGGGAACKTRLGPGVGLPQLYAVATAAAVARSYKKSIISDGGIKSPDDYNKALAAGADAVMIGGLFAGTEETPGDPFFEDGQWWKIFRGSASLEFQFSRFDRETPEKHIRNPEGVVRRVKYKGTVAAVISELIGYQLSAMSYVGAKNIKELHKKARFIRQTRAGYEEGEPHEVF